MENENQYIEKKPLMEQLQALAVFHKFGMATAEKMFPQHIEFVKSNVNEPFEQLKAQLLHQAAQAA